MMHHASHRELPMPLRDTAPDQSGARPRSACPASKHRDTKEGHERHLEAGGAACRHGRHNSARNKATKQTAQERGGPAARGHGTKQSSHRHVHTRAVGWRAKKRKKRGGAKRTGTNNEGKGWRRTPTHEED
eukprot:NODE_2966_length_721_cov_13.151786_g2093_i0.p2 GENE.NODE_2966_length_721_cov_13.151786_g2093_i0~~NODE_2966_length_721_cov_13.151786_g2093_i0.p2  ORF type:complete len:131 (+),score=8.38 NODE_2966_length_721_cov_13.151786_g2093_i0:245-637(+)